MVLCACPSLFYNEDCVIAFLEPRRFMTGFGPLPYSQGSTYVVDFGENLSGRCQLKVKGEAGTTVTMQ